LTGWYLLSLIRLCLENSTGLSVTAKIII